MESKLKAKQIGGSIGVIIPKDIVKKEGIMPNDTLKVRIEKTSDLNFLWGKFKDVKKSTDKIMREIDEFEDE